MLEKISPNLKQFIRYATVGVFNTAIDFGLLNLFLYLGFPILPANTLAFLTAATNSYFWNKHWTFGDKTGRWQTQLPVYIFVLAVGLALSNGAVYIFTVRLGLDVNLVKFLAIAMIASWNFLAPKLLIFRK